MTATQTPFHCTPPPCQQGSLECHGFCPQGCGVVCVPWTPTASPSPPTGDACLGDCNADGQVTVDEIVRMVNIGLGSVSADTCSAADGNGDGMVTVDEIVSGVNRALNGCG